MSDREAVEKSKVMSADAAESRSKVQAAWNAPNRRPAMRHQLAQDRSIANSGDGVRQPVRDEYAKMGTSGSAPMTTNRET